MGKQWILAFGAMGLLLASQTVMAWDTGGHMLVTEIASRRLKPGVLKKIEPLLPLLDTRCNDGKPYNFITAGAWMDDIRSLSREFPWSKRHYIDLPCSEKAATPSKAPENAYWALKQAIRVLRSRETLPQAQAEAIGQILHIVGDIHQPLHTATRDDRGGNDYLLVPLIPPTPDALSIKPFNLHQFWDTAYRFTMLEGTGVELWKVPSIEQRPIGPGEKPGVIAEQADALLEKFPPERLSELSTRAVDLDPWPWIVQTHDIACKLAWPPGPPPRPNEVGKLTPEFIQASHEIAERQIVIAGCRLASLLNRLFSDPPAPR